MKKTIQVSSEIKADNQLTWKERFSQIIRMGQT